MRRRLITFLATCAYTGYFPVMPGTAGTLWGVAIAYFASGLPLHWQAAVALAAFIVSVPLADEALKYFGGSKDPSQIVCDEVCGLLVSFLFIPFTALNAILVFLLFRFFDILKPYPVNVLDEKVPGGLGVVIDDVAAGVYANISAHVIIWLIKGRVPV